MQPNAVKGLLFCQFPSFPDVESRLQPIHVAFGIFGFWENISANNKNVKANAVNNAYSRYLNCKKVKHTKEKKSVFKTRKTATKTVSINFAFIMCMNENKCFEHEIRVKLKRDFHRYALSSVFILLNLF